MVDDLDAVRRCVRLAYGRYSERMAKAPAPMFDDYAQLIADGVVHVAEVAGDLVGLIVMWSKHDHFYVDNIATDPDAQGTGVGAALLRHADDIARSEAHDEIRLYTHVTMAENIRWYPRRGFVETHRATDNGYERVYFSRYLA